MQEYISVTYSNSKTGVCPHSWTRPSCCCGRPCQGWGRRWRPWRGRCHRRRRGTSSSPAPPAPPAPEPPLAPASPFLTCLLLSWQKSGMKSWRSSNVPPECTTGLSLLENKGGKLESKRKARLESKKERGGQGKAERCGSWWCAAAQNPSYCNWSSRWVPSSLPQDSSLAIWQGNKAIFWTEWNIILDFAKIYSESGF